MAGRSVLAIATAMAGFLAIVGAGGLCPARCRCDDESLLASCARAGLEVVPIQLNPDLRQLDLSGNRVASLHMTFVFYGNLERLDLSDNAIRTLGAGNFDLQPNLLSLNVSHNDIGTLAKSALRGLKALRHLDLSDNNITVIDPQAFKDVAQLESLNLNGNAIISLPDGLLDNLHKIKVLLLARNSILETPSANLGLAPTLQVLDLRNNLIQELSEDSLVGLTSLLQLDLSNNMIVKVSDRAFDGLSTLTDFNLAGNNLGKVPTAALARLNALSTLKLSGNPIERLEAVSLRNLFDLKHLEMENCRISWVHARAFADNVNLEVISLDGNRQLEELPSRVLYGAMYLKSISLKRCSLATLQPTDFPVDGLTHLALGGNPFVCNCSLHWLWNVLQLAHKSNRSRLELDAEDIVCADEELAGRALLGLPESSLRCRISPLYLSLSAAGCLVATATILALIAQITRVKRRKRAPYSGPNRPEFLVYVGETGKNESCSSRLLARNDDTLRGESTDRKYRAQTDPQPGSRIYDAPYQQPTFQPQPEGLYAVADVTGLPGNHVDQAPPEVLSLYRMSDRNHREFNYDYDYNVTVDRPHVVFV